MHHTHMRLGCSHGWRVYILWVVAFIAGGGLVHLNRHVHLAQRDTERQQEAIVAKFKLDSKAVYERHARDAWGVVQLNSKEWHDAFEVTDLAPTVLNQANAGRAPRSQPASAPASPQPQPPLPTPHQAPPPDKSRVFTHIEAEEDLHVGPSDGEYLVFHPDVSVTDAVARKAMDIASMNADSTSLTGGGYIPVALELQLGQQWATEEIFNDHKAMFHQ